MKEDKTKFSVEKKIRSYSLATGAEPGLDSSPKTIREGTVRMQEHPNYFKDARRIIAAGFKIILIEKYDARVEVNEVVSNKGEFLRMDYLIFLQRDMRYLDMEHEYGHIKQLIRRFKEIPITERVIDPGNGEYKKAVDIGSGEYRRYKDQSGTLGESKMRILEFHNRLQEYIRLHNRGVNQEVLRLHAEGVEERTEYYNEINRNRCGSSKIEILRKWCKDYFYDIPELYKMYRSVCERSEIKVAKP
ncbi:MAG TPA: hypothetical protein VFS21_34765 [Roseiflexaceae bacterium]|nr:hypothetical protein [Roseiflexaceae bacterium]